MEESPPLSSLQPEILLHIFHKLPVKSIHKCKLVCKEWLSLISDPFFKSNYNSSSIPNHPLNLIMIPKRYQNFFPLVYDEINTTTITQRVARPQPLPWTFTSSDCITITGSCNGLVALYRHPGVFCLFNPYTGGEDQITVHVPMEEDEYFQYYTVLYGLCYDNVNDEYKAVLCILRLDDEELSFYVVNFRNGSWKLKPQSQMQDLQSRRVRGTSGTIVKNVPYWVCRDNIALDDNLIIYFDSKTEEFKEGPRVPKGEKICGLGTLDGQLTASFKSDLGLEVWAFKEDGNGDWCWSMLFVMANKLWTLSTLTWIGKEDEVLIDVNGGELMVYNIKDGSLRQLQRRMRRSLYNILVYLPSFISPI